MITVDAILLGGGAGSRFSDSRKKSASPKQFELIADKPVFIHALQRLLSLNCFRQVVLVFPKPYLSLAEDQVNTYLPAKRFPNTVIRIIAGGNRRQDSSRLAIEATQELTPAPTRILIHDACRPYLSPTLLSKVKDCLFDRSYGAWVPVIPLVETIKKIANDRVVETVDRQTVQSVQTPQIFEFAVIKSMTEKAKDLTEINFTDDASLCEYYGIPVGVFEGDVRNVKLTYSFEISSLKAMLEEQTTQGKPCEPELVTTFTD